MPDQNQTQPAKSSAVDWLNKAAESFDPSKSDITSSPDPIEELPSFGEDGPSRSSPEQSKAALERLTAQLSTAIDGDITAIAPRHAFIPDISANDAYEVALHGMVENAPFQPTQTRSGGVAPTSFFASLIDSVPNGFRTALGIWEKGTVIAPRIRADMKRDGKWSTDTERLYRENSDQIISSASQYSQFSWTDPRYWFGSAAENAWFMGAMAVGSTAGRAGLGLMAAAAGVTVTPAAALTASVLGGLYATYDILRNLSYMNMIESGIPHQQAEKWSAVNGATEWALEYLQIKALRFLPFEKAGFGSKVQRMLLRRQGSELAIRAMTVPTVRQALGRAALGSAESYATENLEEMLQEIGSIGAEYFARKEALGQGVELPQITKAEAQERIIETVKRSLGTMLVLSSWDAGVSTNHAIGQALDEQRRYGHIKPLRTRDVDRFLKSAILSSRKANVPMEDLKATNSYIYVAAKRIEAAGGDPWQETYKRVVKEAAEDVEVSQSILKQTGELVPVSKLGAWLEKAPLKEGTREEWLAAITSGKSPVGINEVTRMRLDAFLESWGDQKISVDAIKEWESVGGRYRAVIAPLDTLTGQVNFHDAPPAIRDLVGSTNEAVRPWQRAVDLLIEAQAALGQNSEIGQELRDRVNLSDLASHFQDAVSVDLWMKRTRGLMPVNDILFDADIVSQSRVPGQADAEAIREILDNPALTADQRLLLEDLGQAIREVEDKAGEAFANQQAVLRSKLAVLRGRSAYNVNMETLIPLVGPKGAGASAGFEWSNRKELLFQYADVVWEKNAELQVRMDELSEAERVDPKRYAGKMAELHAWRKEAAKAVATASASLQDAIFKYGVFATPHYGKVRGRAAINETAHAVVWDVKWQGKTYLLATEIQPDHVQDVASANRGNIVSIARVAGIDVGGTIPREPLVKGARDIVLNAIDGEQFPIVREVLLSGGVIPASWGIDGERINAHLKRLLEEMRELSQTPIREGRVFWQSSAGRRDTSGGMAEMKDTAVVSFGAANIPAIVLKWKQNPYGKRHELEHARLMASYAMKLGYDGIMLPEAGEFDRLYKEINPDDGYLELRVSWSEAQGGWILDDLGTFTGSSHPDLDTTVRSTLWRIGESDNRDLSTALTMLLSGDMELPDFARKVASNTWQVGGYKLKFDGQDRSISVTKPDSNGAALPMSPGRPELVARYRDQHAAFRSMLEDAYGQVFGSKTDRKGKGPIQIGKQMADQKITRTVLKKAIGAGDLARRYATDMTVVVYGLDKQLMERLPPPVLEQRSRSEAGNAVLRGFVELDRKRVGNVYLTRHADRSTLLHEMIHVLTFQLDESTRKKLAKVLDEESSDPGDWSAQSHEKVARTVEAVIRDGKIPEFAEPEEFLPLWQELQAMMRSVYPTLKGSPLPRIHPRFFDVYEAFFHGDVGPLRRYLKHGKEKPDSGPGLPADKASDGEAKIEAAEEAEQAQPDSAEEAAKQRKLRRSRKKPLIADAPAPTDEDAGPVTEALAVEDIEKAIAETQKTPRPKRVSKKKEVTPSEVEAPVAVVEETAGPDGEGGKYIRISPLFWKSRVIRLVEGFEQTSIPIEEAALDKSRGVTKLTIGVIPKEVAAKIQSELKADGVKVYRQGRGKAGRWIVEMPTPLRIRIPEGSAGVMRAEQALFDLGEKIIRLVQKLAPTVELSDGQSFEVNPFEGFPKDTHAQSIADLHERYRKASGRHLNELEAATVAVLESVKRRNAAQMNYEIQRYAGITGGVFEDAQASIFREIQRYSDVKDEGLPSPQEYMDRRSGSADFTLPEVDALRSSYEEVYDHFVQRVKKIRQRERRRAEIVAIETAERGKKESPYIHVGTMLLGAMAGKEKSLRHYIDMTKHGATDDELTLFIKRLVDENGGEIEATVDDTKGRIVIAADGYPDYYKVGEGKGSTGRNTKKGTVLSRIRSSLGISRVSSEERAATEMGQKLVEAMRKKVADAEARAPVPADEVDEARIAELEEQLSKLAASEETVPVVEPDGIESPTKEKVAAGFALGRKRSFRPDPTQVLRRGEGVFFTTSYLMNGFKTFLMRFSSQLFTQNSGQSLLDLLRGSVVGDTTGFVFERDKLAITGKTTDKRRAEMLQAIANEPPSVERLSSPDAPPLSYLNRIVQSGEALKWTFVGNVETGTTREQGVEAFATGKKGEELVARLPTLIERAATNPSSTYPNRREPATGLDFLGYYGWVEGKQPRAGAVLADNTNYYVVDAELYDWLRAEGLEFAVSKEFAARAAKGEPTVLSIRYPKTTKAIAAKIAGAPLYEQNIPMSEGRSEAEYAEGVIPKADPVFEELAARAKSGDKEIADLLANAYDDPSVAAIGVAMTVRPYNIGLAGMTLNEVTFAAAEAERGLPTSRPGEVVRLKQQDITDPEEYWAKKGETFKWRGVPPRRRRVFAEPLPLADTPKAVTGRHSKREMRQRIYDLQTLLKQIESRFNVKVEVGKVFYGKRASETFLQKAGSKVLDVYMHNAYHEVGRVVGEYFHNMDGAKPEDISDPVIEAELFNLGKPHFYNVEGALKPIHFPEVRHRGAVEYWRLWLIDKEAAKELAPKFGNYVDSRIARHDGFSDQVSWLRQKFAELRALDPIESIMTGIDFDRTLKDRLNPPLTWRDKLMIHFVDSMHPIATMQRTVGANPGYEEAQRFEHLFRLVQTSDSTAVKWMTYGVRDKNDQQITDRNGKVPTKTLFDIWAEVFSKGHHEDFGVYLVARRHVDDIHKRGIGGRFSKAETQAAVDYYENNPDTAYFKEMAQAQSSVWDTILKKLQDEGIYTEEEIATIMEVNKSYVPFRHIVSHADSPAAIRESAALKRLKGKGPGATMPLFDPLQASIMNIYDIASSTMRRRALMKMSENATMDGAEHFIREVDPPPYKVISSDLQAISGQLELLGIKVPDTIYTPAKGRWAFTKGSQIVRAAGPESVNVHDAGIRLGQEVRLSDGGITQVTDIIDDYTFEVGADAPKDVPSGKLRIGVEASKNAADAVLSVGALHGEYSGKRRVYKTINVGEDGIRTTRYWEILDESLWKAMGMSPKVGMPIFRMAAMFARLLRLGATLSVDFIVRNPARDIQQAMVQSKHQPKLPYAGHVMDFAAATAHILGKDVWYQRFLESGGSQAELISTQRNSFQDFYKQIQSKRSLASIRKEIVTNPREALRWLNDAYNPLDWTFSRLSDLAQFGEQINRVAEFKRAYEYATRELSMEHLDAMHYAGYSARDITVDFKRHGDVMHLFNQYVPFLTATIAGADKLRRSLVTDVDKQKHWNAAIMYYAVPTILFWLINHDDPDYEERPNWEKSTFWHVPAPQWMKDTDPNLRMIKIPKPRGFETIFGLPLEILLDKVMDDDPASINRLKEMIGDIPLDLGLRVVPSMVLPAIEAFANYSFFRGAHIVSEYDQHLPPEFQSSYWTSEVARNMSKYIGVGASKVDHMIYGYTGGLGRSLVTGVDALSRGLKKAMHDSEVDAPAMPEMPWKSVWGQIPGIRGYLAMSPQSGAQTVQEFYAAREKLNGALRLLRTRDPYTVTRVQELYPEFFNQGGTTPFAQRVHIASKSIDKLREGVRGTYQSSRLTPVEKRDNLNILYENLIAVSRWAMRPDNAGKGNEGKRD